MSDPCTATPALFAQTVSNRKWLPVKHLRLLSDYLLDVASGKITHLIVSMPPRHGKSELISKYFPAWYLGQYPDKRIILTSYEAEFAAGWGYKARNLLQEHGHLFGVKVAQDSAARDRWDIAGHTGGMATSGVGGAITGKGCNILIIDDPVKNAEEANSLRYRDRAAEWYKSTAYTRLEPGGSVIIIQTRWHEDDLSGRLLREEPDKWTVINLPAIAEDNDPLGRNPGQALFPRRYNEEALHEIKTTLGAYWFNALYQQHPAPLEGSLFKREYFKYCQFDGHTINLHGKNVSLGSCKVFQTCDPAVSTKASADFFVLMTWAVTQASDLILLDVLKTRMEGPDQITLFNQQYQRWKPAYQAVEAVGVGKTLYQLLLREGLPIRELKASADKVTRALPAAARMEANKIYFVEGAAWLYDLESELLAFPQGAHDDQVDCVSYAVQCAIQQPQTTVAPYGSVYGFSSGFRV